LRDYEGYAETRR
jgi:tetratricopeptide (TPR) repeat protein